MKLKEVRLVKEFKIGLPNYSNMTATCDMTWEVAETEEFDFNMAWDSINSQLSMQTGEIDESWIVTKEYNKFFKTVIKHKKEEV
ncbi:MAG: hypothetical protein WC055_15875 [Melioribacteraceae bacterium]